MEAEEQRGGGSDTGRKGLPVLDQLVDYPPATHKQASTHTDSLAERRYGVR